MVHPIGNTFRVACADFDAKPCGEFVLKQAQKFAGQGGIRRIVHNNGETFTIFAARVACLVEQTVGFRNIVRRGERRIERCPRREGT